jgi:hypothetical protein
MIEEVRGKIKTGEYRLTVHALERCVERNIWPDEVKRSYNFGGGHRRLS